MNEKPKFTILYTEEAMSFLHFGIRIKRRSLATHGIVKKTQKTPLKEILKAEEIRKEYFNNK